MPFQRKKPSACDGTESPAFSSYLFEGKRIYLSDSADWEVRNDYGWFERFQSAMERKRPYRFTSMWTRHRMHWLIETSVAVRHIPAGICNYR